MKLLFIYGHPAAGKYTIAKEVAKLSGWALFHNHLIVDAVAAVFEFGSKEFVKLREKFWLDTFEAAKIANKSLIFTFAPEPSVSDGFIELIRTKYANETIFVQILVSEEIQEHRISNNDRADFGKLRDKELLISLRSSFESAMSKMPKPTLIVDSETMNAELAAKKILEHIDN